METTKDTKSSIQRAMDAKDYNGKWKIPWIDKPEFEDDPNMYVLKPIKHVGIEVLQLLSVIIAQSRVKAGSVFDNVLICDDLEHAKEVVQQVFSHRETKNEGLEEAEKIKRHGRKRKHKGQQRNVKEAREK